METITIQLDRIQEAAQSFIDRMGEAKVFAFYGGMGAGKTTFIRAVCELLGVSSSVNSPTFAIINEYRASTDEPIYHFDFYRIKDISEACDIGTEDYFYSGHYCFIEWPEKIESLLPEDTLALQLSVQPDGSRHLKTLSSVFL